MNGSGQQDTLKCYLVWLAAVVVWNMLQRLMFAAAAEREAG